MKDQLQFLGLVTPKGAHKGSLVDQLQVGSCDASLVTEISHCEPNPAVRLLCP